MELHRRFQCVPPPACVTHSHFGTPLARFVVPQGAPPKAPVPPPACVTHAHFGTPLTCFVAPQGAPPKALAA
eukprot:8069204-Pyramimonas_sp.AAC.1